jgi:hypothetical protein
LQRERSSLESVPTGVVKLATGPKALATRWQDSTGRDPSLGAAQRPPAHFHKTPPTIFCRGEASGLANAAMLPSRGAACPAPGKASARANKRATVRRIVRSPFQFRFETYTAKLQLATERKFEEAG